MGRGVSCGGGRSSLGYLFGSEGTANNASATKNEGQINSASVTKNEGQTNSASATKNGGQTTDNVSSPKPAVTSPPIDKQIPAGIHGTLTNNYMRAEGQNCGNFITDRPSTKVHAAPGGGSSLDYLFGGNGN